MSKALKNKIKLNDQVSVKDFGAVGDGVTDDTAAIQAAMDVGGIVYFPPGRYIVSSPLTRTTTGLLLQGAGIDATIIEPSAAFSGSSVFILGNKYATGECRQISMRNMLIEIKSRVDAGVEMYGLRDGSTFESVYIWKIKKHGFLTGWTNAGNGAPGTMNEGLLFNNCHVLGTSGASGITDGAYYNLSGLYETTFINCKALGYSSQAHTNCFGFLVGAVNTAGLGNADCSGVRLYNCSSGNLYGSGNIGIFFANAFHCSADAHTAENIVGTVFKFGQRTATGTAADQYSASYCLANAPRLYNPASDSTVNSINFEFAANSSQCRVVNCPQVTAFSGHYIAKFIDNAAICSVEVMGSNLDVATVSTFFDFTSTRLSNTVKIFTGSTTTKTSALFARDQYFVERLANGTLVEQTQFYTQYKLSDPIRFSKSDGTQILTVTETGATIFNKALLPTSAVGSTGQVWMDTAAGNTLKVI